jgi:hypothetical protein
MTGFSADAAIVCGEYTCGMEYALWTYPWDILDEGPNRFADRLVELGVSEVNLATNYHSVQAFLPHNPERRTVFAHASSYFQPAGPYGSLEPVSYEQMGDDDWIEKIGRTLDDTDISLNSWTVGCHNSRLGMSHPEATLTNAHDDDLVFGLCPSNPDVREFLRALLVDLDDRSYFDRIELESFDYFYGTGFGWHHDKFHTRLGKLGEFLFGLCFCSHCTQRAEEQGVDVDEARQTVRETVDDIAEGKFPHDVDIAGWLSAHPSVASYIDVRSDALTELYRELADAVNSAELGCYIGFFGVEDTWMHGYDLNELSDVLDYFTVIAYESSPEAAKKRFRIAQQFTDAPLHAGVLPGHPAVYDESTLVGIVSALDDVGAERISFYNYGLLPEKNLDWIKSAISGLDS